MVGDGADDFHQQAAEKHIIKCSCVREQTGQTVSHSVLPSTAAVITDQSSRGMDTRFMHNLAQVNI